jgi:hypothetical protein
MLCSANSTYEILLQLAADNINRGHIQVVSNVVDQK